jgi:regulator of cell morphogenesis and NO signaling
MERLGIDYCCQGAESMADACRRRGLDPQTVQSVLAACEFGRSVDDHGHWGLATTRQLIEHIIAEHHGYIRAELPRLTTLAEKARSKNGRRAAPPSGFEDLLGQFRPALEAHLLREEQTLFPLLSQSDGVLVPADALSQFDQIDTEHAAFGETMHRLREMTNDYQAPEDASDALRALLEGLKEFDRDLHVHLHEESYILIARARTARRAAPARA